MTAPIILLNASSIKKSLPDDIELTILKTTKSTNDFFKPFKPADNIKMHCCLAEQQTQGRGQQNRVWHSPFGQNIYLSCHYIFQKKAHELGGLSLAIGLAIISALRKLDLAQSISIKWPNDILCRDKKLAGILIETEVTPHDGVHAIIGMGINVNMMHEDNDAINQSWRSLCEEQGHVLDRNTIVAVLLEEISIYIKRFENYGFSDFLLEWAAVDHLTSKIVKLNYANQIIIGKVVGINTQGYLMVQLADANNTLRSFSSGEVSLLKE